MFSALFELLTGNFLFFALHFDSRSVFPKPLALRGCHRHLARYQNRFQRRRSVSVLREWRRVTRWQRISLSNTISVLWHTL